MQLGVISVCVSPMRKEPNHRSEMTSQCLFGQAVKVIGQNEDWYLIRCESDEYEGWITKSHLQKSSAFQNDHRTEWGIIVEPLVPAQIITNKQASNFFLTAGCRFPIQPSKNSEVLTIDFVDFTVEISKKYVHKPLDFKVNLLLEKSQLFLNTPYLWGGKTIFGTDCSGFIQTLFSLFAFSLPRDAWQQALVLQEVSWEDRTPGDIVFFHQDNQRISHVALLSQDDFVTHANGRVRIDPVSSEGIFNTEQAKITHRNPIAKTIRINEQPIKQLMS